MTSLIGNDRKSSMLFGGIVTLFFFLALDIFFLIVEIWIPPQPVDIGLGFVPEIQLFTPDMATPGLRNTNPDRTRWFQAQHFLDPKPEGVFRVIAIGGSSVHGLHVPLRRMAERLSAAATPMRVEIINAGGGSYGTHRLVFVANEVVRYQPDLVFIYSGNNEFEESRQLKLAKIDSLWLQKLVKHYAPARFMRDRLVEHRAARLRQNKLAKDVASPPELDLAASSQEQIQARMNAYESNLRAIVTLFKGRGVPVYIATVPSNHFRYREDLTGDRRAHLISLGESKEAYAYLKRIVSQSGTRHQSSELENAIIHRLAAESSVRLLDIEALVAAAEPHGIPGETLFADHCHLNAGGQAILIAELEKAIQEDFFPNAESEPPQPDGHSAPLTKAMQNDTSTQ